MAQVISAWAVIKIIAYGNTNATVSRYDQAGPAARARASGPYFLTQSA